MNARHGLSDKTVAQINAVLRRFPEVEEALLFGSRAKGTYKRGSDIDLALIGNRLDWRKVGKIEDALDDILLPYKFSLIILGKRTDPGVAAHVGRVGMNFYQREPIKVGVRAVK